MPANIRATHVPALSNGVMGGAAPKSLTFFNVSNIDQQRRLAMRHASSIAARHRQPSVTESLVTLPPEYRKSVVSSTSQFLTAIERPRCSRCQARMMLERVSSGPIGFERRLFECPKCDQVEMRVIASDPLKSNAVGWLTGELTAPN